MRRRWLLLKEQIENFKDPKYRTISVLGIDKYNKQQESYFNLLKKIEDNKILKDENSLAQNLKNYAAAELTHATQGPASEADAAARLAICMACEHRAVTYKEQTDENGVGWCTKCGCGNNPRAMLTVKVTLAGVECPLAKWGKVEGTGASVASAVDAVAGVAKSIIHKLSGG